MKDRFEYMDKTYANDKPFWQFLKIILVIMTMFNY